MQCNPAWEAVSGLIRGILGLSTIDYVVARQEKTWFLNGKRVPGLEHLVDLDFSFTPATNLTQLRRVSLPIGRAVQVPVAWFDLRSGALAELRQVYRRQEERLVWYEAPTEGYRGLLEFDADGFIKSYPMLWQAEATSNFQSEDETE